MTSKALTIFCLLAVCVATIKLSTQDDGMEQKIKDSPCQPSDAQRNAYKTCVSMLYGNRHMSGEDLSKPENAKRVGACVWNKLGIIGGNGFNMDALKKMVEEMPSSDEVKEKIVSTAEACKDLEGIIAILECIGEKRAEICNI